MDFNKELLNRVEYIEEIINKQLCDENDEKYLQREIFNAMNYSILAGGKRLRPMLLLECLRLFGGDDKEADKFMCAIEMIHTYSLVHDDLPAMDNDEYRRGKKTTHIVFGEGMGILAGDALLNYAFETGIQGVKDSENTANALMALDILSRKAGVFGMIGGQVVDIKNENRQIDIDTLDYINELKPDYTGFVFAESKRKVNIENGKELLKALDKDIKSGALIEASMMMGAALAGARENDIKLIEKAGSYIGKAFQIQDDILDVTSTSEVLGKNVLSDDKNHKSTYVNLLGIDGASQKVKELSEEALRIIDSFDNKNEFLTELIESLIYRKK